MSDYLNNRRLRKLGLADPLPTKKSKVNPEYQKKSKAFLALNQFCQINAPGCTGRAQGIHHKAGRVGDKLMDQKFWMAACNSCNLWVEVNDKEAREKGFKVSRLS